MSALVGIYERISGGEHRRNAWLAMKYFIKHRRYLEAAKCRDMLPLGWTNKGPVGK